MVGKQFLKLICFLFFYIGVISLEIKQAHFMKKGKGSRSNPVRRAQSKNVIHCAGFCLKTPNCSSFSYEKTKENCLLFDEFTPLMDTDFEYYVKMESFQKQHQKEKTPRLFAVKETKGWYEANAHCAIHFQGTLAVIHDDVTMKAVVKFIEDNFDANETIWIGLDDIISNGNYIWSDNERLTEDSYQNWAIGLPDNISDEGCVALFSSDDESNDHEKGQWDDFPCNRLFPFICEENTLGDIVLITEMLTYIEARNRCASIGKDWQLAVFFTLESQKESERSFLGRDYTERRWYIGLNDLEEEGYFVWEGGKAVEETDYENWRSGEPDNKYGKEHCGLIGGKYREDSPRKWNDADCDKKHWFLCQRQNNKR